MPEQAWCTSVLPGMFAGYTQTCETEMEAEQVKHAVILIVLWADQGFQRQKASAPNNLCSRWTLKTKGNFDYVLEMEGCSTISLFLFISLRTV